MSSKWRIELLGMALVCGGCGGEMLEVFSSVDAGAMPNESRALPSEGARSSSSESPGAAPPNGSSSASSSFDAGTPGPDAAASASSTNALVCDENWLDQVVSLACFAELGERCYNTINCCAGTCVEGADRVARCTLSGKCVGECGVCESDSDCCEGECKSRHGGTRRCIRKSD